MPDQRDSEGIDRIVNRRHTQPRATAGELAAEVSRLRERLNEVEQQRDGAINSLEAVRMLAQQWQDGKLHESLVEALRPVIARYAQQHTTELTRMRAELEASLEREKRASERYNTLLDTARKLMQMVAQAADATGTWDAIGEGPDTWAKRLRQLLTNRTASAVDEIERRRVMGEDVSIADVARDYGMDPRALRQALYRRRQKHEVP